MGINSGSTRKDRRTTNIYKQYDDKLVSAKEAVSIIKSGDWVDYGWCTGMPVALDKALANRTDELWDIKVRGGIALRELAIFEREDAIEHFTWNSWHMSAIERRIAEKGAGFYAPIRYAEFPRYYREKQASSDVAMIQVAPMDSRGYFNFGPNCSHLNALCETTKKIIVEVNENMPYCIGKEFNGVHISQVKYIIEGDNPEISTIAPMKITPEDMKVAELVVNEIQDGACIQLGIGGMPNAIGSLIAKSDLKDLAVHSEMYVDAFMEMTKAGKINGSRKALDRYKQVYSFAAGSKELYDFIDSNEELLCAPVDYINEIFNIASIDDFISINSCLEVDLFGQVSSESVGYKHISGAGGQLDFVLGGYLSDGGMSFLCCPSIYVDKKGVKHSRIRGTFDAGTIVTDTRANTNYIVTEYGMVNIKGLTTWQRAEQIINIAHPDFRDELIKEAESMNIWRKSNKR